MTRKYSFILNNLMLALTILLWLKKTFSKEEIIEIVNLGKSIASNY